MAVRKLKPVTPGQRFKVISGFDTITTSTPEKSLLKPIKKIGWKKQYRKDDHALSGWWS
jgi:large subunit ribosomal protein L2